MSLIHRFLDWCKPCKHLYIFVKTINERNMRYGIDHKSHIYVCRHCGKREIREDYSNDT